MPLRPYFLPIASRLQRLAFHTSAAKREGSENHYEILQIPRNASQKEVKKSFYTLSKTHHPDRNPSDPTASERFVRISNAYAILGDPPKRQAYDREHLPSSHHSTSHPHTRGSYHSSNPAGGRSPSGLSRRRTQFRGPPPSFYRSGGWGSHSAKRKAAQEETTHDYGKDAPEFKEGGGMGPGQRSWGHGANDVPHFDREGHFRTHESQEQRRQRRMREGFMPGPQTRGTLAQFLFITSIIGIGVLVPSFLFERFVLKQGPKKDEK